MPVAVGLASSQPPRHALVGHAASAAVYSDCLVRFNRPRASLHCRFGAGSSLPPSALALGAGAAALQQRRARRCKAARAALGVPALRIPGWLPGLGGETQDSRPQGLRGNWSPVHTESEGLRAEVVEGAIPDDFPAGHFVQNGPNPRHWRPNSAYHPFEGDGMLHSVEFARDGPDWAPLYSNKWVRTSKWLAEDMARGSLTSGLFDDNLVRLSVNVMLNIAKLVECLGRIMLFKRYFDLGTANTSVVHHAGRVYALQEGSRPIEVRMPDLQTKGALEDSPVFSAHPKVCPVTGELIWFNWHHHAGLSYGVWDREHRPVHETVIELPHNVMVHDIAVTTRHTVILDCPLRINPDFENGHGPVHLNKEVPMRLGVLPRHGSGDEVEWYEVPGPGKMCFHTMNAYEREDGDIVVVGCALPDVSIWNMNTQHSHKQALVEWRISPDSRRVAERTLSDVPCDFPRVSEQVLGRPFRYGYAAAFAPAELHLDVPRFKGVTKHDVQAAQTLVWDGGDSVFNGEPVFVPRAGADRSGGEDDGYLLVYTRDEAEGVSEVVILDARRFGEGPICRIRLPHRVPYGFHVGWMPAEQGLGDER